MNVDVNFKWQPGAKNKIEQAPKKMLYDIARITLDTTYQNIPLSNNKNSGKLRTSSINGGVREDNQGYYIGSYTNYAKYVWKMGANTKWSTPNTFGKWYAEVYRKQYNNINKQAVERNKLK